MADHRQTSHGSVIALVVIFTAVLALMAGGLITYTMTERTITKRTMLGYEADNAVDAALEYGAAELIQRFNGNRSFGTNNLTAAPIKSLVNRRATLFATGAGTYDDVVPGSVQLWASQVSKGTQQYIDPGDPNNAFDPLRGQTVSVQTVRLLAQAEAQDSAGNSRWAYSSQQFEVRDASLFSYAIFYNLTMEFQPSPNMTVVGPVRANQDVYLTTGGTLQFLSTFATAGKFYAMQATQGRPTGQNIMFFNGLYSSGGAPQTSTINDPTLPNGTNLATYVDSNLNSRVSTLQFSDVASQLWRGNVQDSSMGVQPANPPGVVDATTAHQLIEPPNITSSANPTIEPQKYANKSGLYLVVGSDGSVNTFTNATDAVAYKAAVTAGTTASWLTTVDSSTGQPNQNKILVLPSGAVTTQRVMWDARQNTWVNTVDLNVGVLRTAVDSTSSTPQAQVITMNTTTTTTTVNPPSSVTTTTASPWNLDHSGSTGTVDSNDQGWNGMVYVDVMSPTTGRSTKSDVSGVGTRIGTMTAVRLLNGSQLPERTVVTPSAADGFTLATNAPAYVIGDYNATYSSSDSPTVPSAGEVPAAIAADAVNILSNNWMGTVSGNPVPVGDGVNLPSGSEPSATNTEVAAAFMTGIVSTAGGAGINGSSINYSGGVENYPRFHENWSGQTFLYRGSIVALFNSQIATGSWTKARYGAPTRNWGFDQIFGNSRRFPPGTPILRTYRRITYQRLTAAQFATAKADTMLNYTQMQ